MTPESSREPKQELANTTLPETSDPYAQPVDFNTGVIRVLTEKFGNPDGQSWGQRASALKDAGLTNGELVELVHGATSKGPVLKGERWDEVQLALRNPEGYFAAKEEKAQQAQRKAAEQRQADLESGLQLVNDEVYQRAPWGVDLKEMVHKMQPADERVYGADFHVAGLIDALDAHPGQPLIRGTAPGPRTTAELYAALRDYTGGDQEKAAAAAAGIENLRWEGGLRETVKLIGQRIISSGQKLPEKPSWE